MTDVELQLREHFSVEADDVPIDTNLLGGVDELRRSRQHRRFLAGGSILGIAVLAAAIAVPVAVLGRHGARAVVTVSPNQQTVPTTPPPGERAVTWAGIQFYVPVTWTSGGGTADMQWCGQDEHPGGVVMYLSDVPETLQLCSPSTHPVLEQLEMGIGSAVSAPTPGQLDGLPAVYTRTTVRGQLVTSVQVPSRGAVFTLTTNTRARADAILASAHRVSVDENGCAVDQPAHLAKVAGGGTGGLQVTSKPVSGVVCSYSAGGLVTGVTLSAQQLTTVTALLNALPAQYTPAERAAQRHGSVLDRGGLASIRLKDAGGRTQQITVQAPTSGVRPGVAGATQSALTQALTADLSDVLPSGFGPNAYQTGQSAELPEGSLGNLELTTRGTGASADASP